MKTIIVHICVKPGFVQDFIDATKKSQSATTSEEGCLSYDILQDIADEHKFTLSEVYKDDDAIEDHKLTTHFLEWRSVVQEMMACPRVSSKHNTI